MKRTLVIGDVHGCYEELCALLDEFSPSTDDAIIALGDVVDRGPDSAKVLAFFQQETYRQSLMGNHERKHIRSFHGSTRPALSQLITRHQIGPRHYPSAVDFMATFPLYLALDDAILVHGFVEPNIPLCQQREVVLAGTMGGRGYLEDRYDRPWYELYTDNKPVIVGHLDYSGNATPFIYQDRVFAIDTQCHAGGALTGLILPGFRIISVPSRKDYWEEVKRKHKSVVLGLVPKPSDPWAKIDEFICAVESQQQPNTALVEECVRLKEVVEKAEEVLRDLLEKIAETNELIIAKLQAQGAYDHLDERGQGRVYAAQIEGHPLGSLLHDARKGHLSRSKLRARLRSPAKVFDAMEEWLRAAKTDRGSTDAPPDQ
jgi:serine/threonine protein phosphatase 1